MQLSRISSVKLGSYHYTSFISTHYRDFSLAAKAAAKSAVLLPVGVAVPLAGLIVEAGLEAGAALVAPAGLELAGGFGGARGGAALATSSR